MKKFLVLFSLLLVAGMVLGCVGCGSGGSETGFYTATAVVQATGPEAAIRLTKDNTAKNVDVTLKETAGKGAMIESVSWTIIDATGVPLTSGSEEWVPPKEISAGGKTTVSFDIKYLGSKTGPYYLEYKVSGYDTKYGQDINSIQGYTEVDIS